MLIPRFAQHANGGEKASSRRTRPRSERRRTLVYERTLGSWETSIHGLRLYYVSSFALFASWWLFTDASEFVDLMYMFFEVGLPFNALFLRN